MSWSDSFEFLTAAEEDAGGGSGQGTTGQRERDAGEEQRSIDQDKPLYVISVAAELVDMHPQTLRLYERKGDLVSAGRLRALLS